MRREKIFCQTPGCSIGDIVGVVDYYPVFVGGEHELKS